MRRSDARLGQLHPLRRCRRDRENGSRFNLDEDIAGLDIPTGIPLGYELDDNLRPISEGAYMDPEAAAAGTAAASQGADRRLDDPPVGRRAVGFRNALCDCPFHSPHL